MDTIETFRIGRITLLGCVEAALTSPLGVVGSASRQVCFSQWAMGADRIRGAKIFSASIYIVCNIDIYRFRLIFGNRRKGIKREEGGGGAPDRGRFDLVVPHQPADKSTHRPHRRCCYGLTHVKWINRHLSTGRRGPPSAKIGRRPVDFSPDTRPSRRFRDRTPGRIRYSAFRPPGRDPRSVAAEKGHINY